MRARRPRIRSKDRWVRKMREVLERRVGERIRWDDKKLWEGICAKQIK